MSTKQIFAAVAVSTAITTFAATVPTVSSVTMAQSTSSRLVTITYNVDAEAVITLDVQTNATANAAADDSGWASIGGEAIWNARGDVWKKVASGDHTITWRPDLSWPDHKVADGCARAVVTAWALDNTPDYMVVDLTSTGGADTQTYYPAADFVPGGVSNSLYKTSTLLMRKIMAKDVTWTMGSVSEAGRNATREATHLVKLDSNYYIGVYEVTQTQWEQISGYNPSHFTADRMMRPVEMVSYTDIRQGEGTASDAASAAGGVYPSDPYDNSFLGLLRNTTKLDFDLPSEAQWEFAARAGYGEGYWGNGSIIQSSSNTNLDQQGRYDTEISTGADASNKADTYNNFSESTSPVSGGTAVVGSYAPNDWGLYDVHGNVNEWCVDCFANDITSLKGAVNTSSSEYRSGRGGSWRTQANALRPAYRGGLQPANRQNGYGFRVVCTAGLQ